MPIDPTYFNDEKNKMTIMTKTPDSVDVRIPYIAKAERLSYLIFLAMLGPIIILGIITALWNQAIWPIPLIATIILLLIWLLIGSNKICLLENRIVLKSLLSSHEISYSEISRFEFGYRHTGRGSIPALFIFCKTDTKPRSILIKPFSKRDLRLVEEVLSRETIHGVKRK